MHGVKDVLAWMGKRNPGCIFEGNTVRKKVFGLQHEEASSLREN
jgi:hypothetical protein